MLSGTAGTGECQELGLGSDEFFFEIGRGEWGSARAMIDEVRVSDRALPVSWITADFVSHSDPTAALIFSEISVLPC